MPARWFGHVPAGSPRPPRDDDRLDVVPLELDAGRQRDVIDGYCNRTLWPALHGLVANVEQRPEWWSAYAAHGDETASRISATVEHGALVWIHDYHHFAVAQPLRERRPDVGIGLFCHTPFDEPAMSGLTDARELRRRLSHFDVIGTQTPRDARELGSFLRAGGEPAPRIEATPVGFDVDTWLGYRTDPVVTALAERARRGSGVLAVGVDRVDYTKGLLPKLLAVEIALDRGSISPDDFRLIQIAVPSRATIPVYSYLNEQVVATAHRITAEHERADGRPVIEVVHQQVAPREVAAVMRAADVALVTPFRDGMNLVALEYSVLNGDRPNELILSEGAGAAQHVGELCTLVDGADVTSIADAIERTTIERPCRERAERRAATASQLTAERWAERFLGLLREMSPSGSGPRRPGPLRPGSATGSRTNLRPACSDSERRGPPPRDEVSGARRRPGRHPGVGEPGGARGDLVPGDSDDVPSGG